MSTSLELEALQEFQPIPSVGRARAFWSSWDNARMTRSVVVLEEDEKGPLLIQEQPLDVITYWKRVDVDPKKGALLEVCDGRGEETGDAPGAGGGVPVAGDAAQGWTKSQQPTHPKKRRKPGKSGA